MPIYEFVCEKCHLEFEELFSSSSDNGSVACPGCGSENTRKVFSAFATSDTGSGDSLPPSDCSSCPNSSCAARNG